MKILFIIISIFCYEVSQSQSLKNDWKQFNCENWTLKIVEEKSIFLGKEIQYVVTFINTKGNSKGVEYYVYKKLDIDSSFKEEVQNFYMMQSCLFVRGKFNFGDFYINDYYYFLKPCHCNTKENNDCGNLAENIEKYIIEK